MIDGNFALALTAGMIVTVNPCGFAMLPAYLSSFLGLSGANRDREPGAAAVVRALVVSAAVTLGFMAVFLVLGTLARAGADVVYDVSKWLTIVIGAVLIVLGIAMARGYKPPLFTPRIDKGGQSRSFSSMFVFGLSYAVASLGCSLGPFTLVVFAGGENDGILSGALSFLVYGLGFGLVLTLLTVSLAVAQGGFLKLLRKTLRFIDRISATLIIIAGLYLLWYGISSVRDSTSAGGITGRGFDISARLQTFVQDNRTILLVLAAIAIAGAVGAMVFRRRTPATND